MSLPTDEQLSMLMEINKLSYSPSVNASMSNRRQYKSYAFQPQNLSSGQVAQINVNSGSDFISGPTSYIACSLTFPTTDSKWNQAQGGSGSAFNIWNEFQISHRSGDVLDRTDRVNVLVSSLIGYLSQDYADNLSGIMDWGSNTDLTKDVATPYVFPLFLFSGLFAQKALIPGQLMAGSRIKIQLESKETALCVDATDYTVSDLRIVLDSIDLFDSAKKTLIEQSANIKTSGLQYSYYSWFHLSKQESTAQLNFDINYSAAMTMNLLVKCRLTDNLASFTTNAMDSVAYPYNAWRMRLGSQVMPEFEVQNSRESYIITTNSLGTADDCDLLERNYNHCGVSYAKYKSTHGVVCQSLEKNPILALSGEVTNNSRLLNFTATLSGSAARTFDAYLQHLRVVNIMLDNVVVNR